MNIESVKTVFALFSGETDIERYSPLIALAVSETEKMLVSESVGDDIRLDFLCAAVANYRLCQLNAAHDRSESAYMGRALTTPQDSGTLKYAEKLLWDYINLCSDIVKPRTFMFAAFGCGTEELC